MIKYIDKKSLKFKLWAYFVIFAATIMLLLWLLQIVFLNSYYETMKTNEIKRIGNSLVLEYGKEGFEDLLYTTSLSEGIVIQILDEKGSLVYPLNILDMIRQPRLEFTTFATFLNNLYQSPNNYVVYPREDVRFRNPTLVYGAILENNEGSNYFLYINSILQPVDSTANVLQNQLIIVTFISLILSFGLSFIIAAKLTKPIEDITKSATGLAHGNYNVEFSKGDYTEIDNLADTLNYATIELSKTEQLRRDLIANVSHDLRTPLAIIKSYGEMIRDISGNNEEKRNYHIKTIIDEADRLSGLVNDILDLSKAQSGLTSIEFNCFDINNITKDIIKRFGFFTENEGVQFNVNTTGATVVYGDENQIEQVIYNLISNGINYSGEDKSIAINIIDEGESINYQVIDKGEGIPEDEIGSIWDRYYKVGKLHKRAATGSGIGLSIVKAILVAHNAEYGVESQVGEGSKFYFKLKKCLDL